MASANTLGLDFDKNAEATAEKPVSGEEKAPEAISEQPGSPVAGSDAKLKPKAKPYVNTERVKTGGAAREKLSEEELAERMARMREQNEKIKQRQADIQADADAFKKTEEADRQKQARHKRIQEGVNRAREQNAQRKMDKVQSREWDSGKPANERRPSVPKKQPSSTDDGAAAVMPAGPPSSDTPTTTAAPQAGSSGEWARGGAARGSNRGQSHSGRGRGRGRGGTSASHVLGDASTPPADSDKTVIGQAL